MNIRHLFRCDYGCWEDTGREQMKDVQVYDFWDPYGGDTYTHVPVLHKVMARACKECGRLDYQLVEKT